MWSVITKIFTRNSNNDGGGDVAVAEGLTGDPDAMDDTKQVSQPGPPKPEFHAFPRQSGGCD
jgi:hypothetical protein